MEGFKCLSCTHIKMYPNWKGYTYICGYSGNMIYSTSEIYVDEVMDLVECIKEICPLNKKVEETKED